MVPLVGAVICQMITFVCQHKIGVGVANRHVLLRHLQIETRVDIERSRHSVLPQVAIGLC